MEADVPKPPPNTITAIKKKITVRDNAEGLSEIQHNLETASICSSVGIVERALGQLEVYDYMNEYIDLTSNSTKSRDLLSFSKCYTSDPLADHPVTSIHPSPFSKSIFLASYASSPASPSSFEGFCALWDLMITDHPYRVLSAPESVTATHFHNLDRNLLIGGLYNGRIVVWDLSSETGIQTQSNLHDEQSSLPVVGLEAFGSSTLSGILSVSSDGVVCIWSQNSFIDPIITTNLNSLTIDSHALEQPILPTAISPFNGELSSFLVGSEDGSLYSVIIRDNVVSIDARLLFHCAPITAIATRLGSSQSRVSWESTVVRSLVLTSSFDWQIALWAPSTSSRPLAVFSAATSYVTSVQWHPVNPAIFAAAVEGGVVQVWNVLQDRDMPLVTTNIASSEAGRSAGGVTCLRWSDNGRSLLVGTEGGRILVLEMKTELVEIREEGYAMMNRLVDEWIQDLNSEV